MHTHMPCQLMAMTRLRAGGYDRATFIVDRSQTRGEGGGAGFSDAMALGYCGSEEETPAPHLPRPIPIHYFWD